MAKTNFTKVEEILDEGLRKITVHHLYDLADKASKNDKIPSEAETQSAKRLHTLSTLLKDIKILRKKGFDPQEKWGIKTKDLKNYIENPETINDEAWNKITGIKTKVDECKKSLAEGKVEKKDEDLINEQRRRHVTKRFNINEKWLPLK